VRSAFTGALAYLGTEIERVRHERALKAARDMQLGGFADGFGKMIRRNDAENLSI
jgi:hypothetical protein